MNRRYPDALFFAGRGDRLVVPAQLSMRTGMSGGTRNLSEATEKVTITIDVIEQTTIFSVVIKYNHIYIADSILFIFVNRTFSVFSTCPHVPPKPKIAPFFLTENERYFFIFLIIQVQKFTIIGKLNIPVGIFYHISLFVLVLIAIFVLL